MGRTSDKWRDVVIYCTLCGNRSGRIRDGGSATDLVFRIRQTEIAAAEAELAQLACSFCGESMAIRELTDEDGGPDGLVRPVH